MQDDLKQSMLEQVFFFFRWLVAVTNGGQQNF